MALQGCIHIVRFKCEMKFIIAKVIFFLAIPQPGELQFVNRAPVAQKHDEEASIRRLDPLRFPEPQRLLIKGNRLFKISHIQVIVCKRKLH